MVQIDRNPAGPGWVLRSELWVEFSVGEVFDFFSDAFQLEAITPAWLKFHVRTPPPIVLSEGSRIDYRLSLHGIPIRWQSVIRVWEPPHRFVDEQVRGPYSFWHHTHTFVERDGGTLCGDVVHYGVPGGSLINRLFVERDVRRIFEYRRTRIPALLAGRALAKAATFVTGAQSATTKKRPKLLRKAKAQLEKVARRAAGKKAGKTAADCKAEIVDGTRSLAGGVAGLAQ